MQDSGGKRAGTRILEQDSLDRKAWAGQLEQKILGRTGQPEKTVGIVGAGQEREEDGKNITVGQGSWERTTEMGQPRT
jgi:hypothetical protein